MAFIKKRKSKLTFEDFHFDPQLMSGLQAMGFKQPTPIQEQAIPQILSGRDLIGIAQTGTGKTAAFVLPVLHKIMVHRDHTHIRALIVVPTRELALQIDQAVEAYSYYTGISSAAVYGGTGPADFDRERTAMSSGVEIVIATPGRLIAHMNLGYVDFSKLDYLILDEADRMLDMGFYPSLMQIVRVTNPKRQTLLFSATMPDQVFRLARNLQNDPVTVSIALSKPVAGVSQGAFIVFEDQKMKLIEHILKKRTSESILVFSSTKRVVSDLTNRLQRLGLNVERISSDLEQADRERVMNDFRNRKVNVLVATDVVSRGIDIDGIDLVINYDVPADAEDYVHRIGRTARAASKGEAITLVSKIEQSKFGRIESLIGNEVPKLEVPKELGAVPEYQPHVREAGSERRGGFRKNSGGKRPQHKSHGKGQGSERKR